MSADTLRQDGCVCRRLPLCLQALADKRHTAPGTFKQPQIRQQAARQYPCPSRPRARAHASSGPRPCLPAAERAAAVSALSTSSLKHLGAP